MRGLLALASGALARGALAAAPPRPLLGVEFVGWPLPVVDVTPFALGPWLSPTSGAAVDTDADGWPLGDAYCVFFDYKPDANDPDAVVPASMWGNYSIQFDGAGEILINPPSPGLFVSDVAFDPAAWRTTATLTLQQPNAVPGFALGVGQSVRTRGAAVGSGFARLRVVQPRGAPAAAGALLTPAAAAAVAPFHHVRVHEWSATNSVPVAYPGVVQWADRRLRTDALWGAALGGRPLAVGAPWETALEIAAEARTSLWINVPVYASDGFVASLAGLLASGNASLGLPGLRCPFLYVEHGNELWLNTSSDNYKYNRAAAAAEVAAGGSPLNNDGSTDAEAWARRRHAKRLREIAAVFRAAFAAAGSSTVVRPVFAWYQAYADDARGALAWLEDTFGAGAARAAFYALAINAYRGARVFPAGLPGLPEYATPDDVGASLAVASDASVPYRAAAASLARDFGLALASYEGAGWSQPAGVGTAGFNATLAAIVDFNRGDGAAAAQAHDVLVNWPGAEYNFYDLSSPYGPSYCFCPGLAEDVGNATASAKYRGALALLNGSSSSSNSGATVSAEHQSVTGPAGATSKPTAISEFLASAPGTAVGINLGNTLELPVEGPAPHRADERYFDAFAAAGFTLVRIPVRRDNHTLRDAPFTVDAAWLARVKTVVGWATSRGLRALVNSHDDRWIDVAPDAAFAAALPRFLAIWTQVAAAFAGASPLLAFEVFNEPRVMSLASLNTLQASVHAIIRAQDAARVVSVCGLAMDGPWWIASKAAAGLVLPSLADGSPDPNLVLQIHDYDPFGFASPPFSMFEWGSAADVAKARGQLANVTAWARARRPPPAPPLPVLLGEFAVSHLQPNASARLAWYSVMAQASRDAGLEAMSVWDDDGWFTTLNRTSLQWDRGVLRALGLAQPGGA